MLERRHFVRAALAGLVAMATLQAAFADEPVAVEIRDYKFMPDTVTIKAGATIRWTNGEKRTSHSVQFDQGGLHSERLFPGDSWEHSFQQPGRYPYTCDPHNEMKGLVVVTE